MGHLTELQLEQSRKLHRQAMELAFEASMEQAAGSPERAMTLSRQAFALELQAAELLYEVDLEPTRSVLLSSAATLAMDCGNFSEAEKLICRGLTGNPPVEIANDLRDLFEKVNLHRHLDLRGISLAEAEFQMSLAGKGVGFGFVESAAYVNRVQDVEKLIRRTAERRAGKPFRAKGRSKLEIPVYLSAPRAASFAVTFRLGQLRQPGLPEVDSAEGVLSDLLECIDALAKRDSLETRIPDPAYRRNFLGLMKRVAPDGDDVRAIGFTASIGGREHRVQLEVPASEIGSPTPDVSSTEHGQNIEIEGTLKYADSTRLDRDKIGIVDAQGKTHKLHVPEGMMDDIVRPLWDYEVKIKGRARGKLVVLEDIFRVDRSR